MGCSSDIRDIFGIRYESYNNIVIIRWNRSFKCARINLFYH